MTPGEIQDAVRDAFSGEVAPDTAASWNNIVDLGLLTLSVPERLGGLGLGRAAAAAVHVELGRALVPGPAIAQMIVIEALIARAGSDGLLTQAMTGKVMTCALKPLPFRGGVGVGPVHENLSQIERGQAPPPTPPLKGRGGVSCILDADLASQILLVDQDQIAFASVASLTHRPTWDETRRLFDVEIGGEALVLAAGEPAANLSRQLRDTLHLALAADSLGGADAVLAMTTDYLQTRRQFDRPLAMFQALKHRVADLKTELEAATALLWSCAGGASSVEIGALKSLATRTFCRIAEEAIQLHGGIGLTAEYPCHLYLKRAFLNAALGDDNDALDEAAGRALL